MIVSHSLKFIFIHIHRTGGTTVSNLLKTEIKNKLETYSQHGNANSSQKEILINNPNYLVFGYVRNPWDRMLSWYTLINGIDFNNIDTVKENFQSFLEEDVATKTNPENHFHYNQLDYLPTRDTFSNPLEIYKFEEYENETRRLFKRLNVPLYTIPKLNITTCKKYRDFYTEKSIELIRKKCKKDIDFFNYSF